MPNDSQNNADGTVETGVAKLPAPTRAPEGGLAQAEGMQPPALSDEDLKKRQEALGIRRKPAGPPLTEGPGGGAANALDGGAGVPETDVSQAATFDPDSPSVGQTSDDTKEPLESSE
jgi:hypothetical protein